MSNLSVENLSGMIKSGDMESFLGGANIQRPSTPDALVEANVTREMQKQGMNTDTASPSKAVTFGQMLDQSLSQVNEFQGQADRAMKELVAGRNKNIHETMLTVERADASLKLMMQVRNKVLEAYKEIMRMQV